MSEPYNEAKRRLDGEAFDGWILTGGTPPDRKSGHMLCMIDKLGKPYAVGVGETELEACNALVTDMERRARQWVKMLLMVRNCRKAMRIESGEMRDARSQEFLSSPNHVREARYSVASNALLEDLFLKGEDYGTARNTVENHDSRCHVSA